ncbi:hypothetical protein [Hymenobacter cellulosivorans]|uniref:YcxB family protein n=1 Tax=Hymenobacter cellulosivorans TaxID=2932249 RepID=A0ABY4FF98_9BACT|nr:hypothetical protein [Hymenobacter cellulosivorans]UOQ55357.1 hypothetical protein MUN80_11510 [Hymenobacter cellulosivorans]
MAPFVFPNVRTSFPEYARTSLVFTFKSNPLLWVILLPVFNGLFALYVLLTGQRTLPELWDANKMSLLMLLFVLGWPVLLWRSLRKQYDASPALRSGARYTLSDEGMAVLHALGHEDYTWSAVTQAWHIGSWLILLTSQNVGYFLNLRELAGPAQATDVLALLRTHGVKVK